MPRTRSFVMTLLLASGLAGASTAQEPVTGRVSGFVRDIRNQPIAGATVMLVDTKTGTLTNTDGQYSLISTPGMVSLRVTARGFKPIPVTSLRLIANDLVTQDFRLDESEPRLLPYPGFFTGDQVDDPVQYIGGPLPKYPDSLKAAKIEGRVTIRYIIGADGLVETNSLRVLDASRQEFEAPAIEAIKKSMFKPAKIKGTPVRQMIEQVVRFTLK